jgi:hypothetical protein
MQEQRAFAPLGGQAAEDMANESVQGRLEWA